MTSQYETKKGAREGCFSMYCAIANLIDITKKTLSLFFSVIFLTTDVLETRNGDSVLVFSIFLIREASNRDLDANS